jgi:toxin YhaV
VERNGWSLFQHPLFKETFETLTREVERLQASDPKGYQAHPKTKLLHTITKHILEVIPGNPNAPEFRQGNTLGKENRHWFPASFHERFRLFYRFSSKDKIIIYAWVNDEMTLRKRDASTDVYAVFKGMLESGNPPGSFDELKAQSKPDPESSRVEPASQEGPGRSARRKKGKGPRP